MRKSTKLKIFRRKKRSVILSVLKRHSLRQHTTEAILRESRNARRNAEVECRNSADDRRIVRNAETQSVFTAEQRRLEEQKRLDEKERARAARKRNKRRSGPEL